MWICKAFSKEITVLSGVSDDGVQGIVILLQTLSQTEKNVSGTPDRTIEQFTNKVYIYG